MPEKWVTVLGFGVVGAGVVVVVGVVLEWDKDAIWEIVDVGGGVGVLSFVSLLLSILVDISCGPIGFFELRNVFQGKALFWLWIYDGFSWM